MKLSRGDTVRITRGRHAGETASYVDDFTMGAVVPGMGNTVNVTLQGGRRETVDADAIEPAGASKPATKRRRK